MAVRGARFSRHIDTKLCDIQVLITFRPATGQKIAIRSSCDKRIFCVPGRNRFDNPDIGRISVTGVGAGLDPLCGLRCIVVRTGKPAKCNRTCNRGCKSRLVLLVASLPVFRGDRNIFVRQQLFDIEDLIIKADGFNITEAGFALGPDNDQVITVPDKIIIVTGTGKDSLVISFTTKEKVVSFASVKRIVSATAREDIIPGTPMKDIITLLPQQGVIPRTTGQFVIPKAATYRVITGASLKCLIQRTTGKVVIETGTRNGFNILCPILKMISLIALGVRHIEPHTIITLAIIKKIRSGAAIDHIAITATDDGIVAITGIDEIDTMSSVNPVMSPASKNQIGIITSKKQITFCTAEKYIFA